jgi:transposase
MKTERLRAQAEELFVRQGQSIAEIAAQLGLGARTVAQWSGVWYWNQKRRAQQFASAHPALEALKGELARRIKEIGDNEKVDPDQIDALNKLDQTLQKMESRLDPIGPMLDGMGRFAHFVAARADADDCAVIHKWMERFLNEERRKNS